MRRALLVGIAAVALTGVLASPASATGDGSGPFSCRASAARVNILGLNLEPFVANPPNIPCRDAHSGVLAPTTIGPVTASLLTADTNNDTGGHAESRVAGLRIALTAVPVIKATVLESSADSSCATGSPSLSGTSTVVGLQIGNTNIVVPNGPFVLNLSPLATLYLNEKVVSGGEVTTRALRLDTALVDVAIAESRADVTGDCPPPPKPECSDGKDNGDPEDDLADIADPGCHTDSNPDNPGSYDPNDNDETDEPECSDGKDNGDPEDDLADIADPGCHTDGDPNNPGSYDPNDDDETDSAKPPQCSDKQDNDGDKLTDFPNDPGCSSADDDDESDDPKTG